MGCSIVPIEMVDIDAHLGIRGGRVERPLGMDHELIAKTESLAHLLVVAFSGDLHVTPTLVYIDIRLAVAARNPHRVAIWVALAFAILLYWLPGVGALFFHRGQHISGPAQVAPNFVLLEKAEQFVHP